MLRKIKKRFSTELKRFFILQTKLETNRSASETRPTKTLQA